MSRHLMCVMTSPAPGKEQEFQRWYDEQHVPDVMRVPGFVTGQRFRLSAVQHKAPPFPRAYLAIYNLDTEDLAALNAEIVRRVGTADMPMTDAVAPGIVRFFLDPVTPRLVTDSARVNATPQNRHVMCVMTSPAPGKEQEFTRWYDEQHVPDVMRVPGVVSGQRFRLSAVQQKARPFPQTYFAFYELDTDDLAAFNAELLGRVGTSDMPMTDALDSNFVRFLLDAVGPRLVNDPARDVGSTLFDARRGA
jgi:hypothetical protein